MACQELLSIRDSPVTALQIRMHPICRLNSNNNVSMLNRVISLFAIWNTRGRDCLNIDYYIIIVNYGICTDNTEI
jgi:hypothetical protein